MTSLFNHSNKSGTFRVFALSVALILATAILFTGCGGTAVPGPASPDDSGVPCGPGGPGDPGGQEGPEGPGYFVGTETAPDAVTGVLQTPTDPSADSREIENDFSLTATSGNFVQSGSQYKITSAGSYTLSGKLSEGQILVEAGESDEVTLVLSGVSISNSSDSPILAKTADKLKIKVADGSYNEISDLRGLKTNDADTTGSAAIYAECDMTISGSGSLVINAGYNNGIHTKDDLKLKEVTLKVTCPDNALKGNDSLTIESGSYILISTSGDGIKTSNSDVSAKGKQRGTIEITGGVFEIFAGCDGIDASYNLSVSGNPSITINTNSYSDYTDESLLKTAQQTQTSTGFGWFYPGGPGGQGGPGGGGSNMSNRAAESAKGLKADNELIISGGTILANCRDDGIHANGDVALENGKNGLGNVTISGGSVTLSVTDDGVHADGTLLIKDGTLNVVNSYEGLEGHLVNVEGGEITVWATDDGINAQSSGGRNSDGVITVSGGRVFVEVYGNDVDGVDSNGSYKQTGGLVIVSNPRANSQGTAAAVDTDAGVTVTGGTIIALGTVPGGGGGGGGRPGRSGIGGMTSAAVPSGSVTFTTRLDSGEHTFTFGEISATFTLKNAVTSGWIWSNGISAGNYTLK